MLFMRAMVGKVEVDIYKFVEQFSIDLNNIVIIY